MKDDSGVSSRVQPQMKVLIKAVDWTTAAAASLYTLLQEAPGAWMICSTTPDRVREVGRSNREGMHRLRLIQKKTFEGFRSMTGHNGLLLPECLTLADGTASLTEIAYTYPRRGQHVICCTAAGVRACT